MPTPNEKLADSLSALQALQKDGRRVFQSKALSRVRCPLCSSTIERG